MIGFMITLLHTILLCYIHRCATQLKFYVYSAETRFLHSKDTLLSVHACACARNGYVYIFREESGKYTR